MYHSSCKSKTDAHRPRPYPYAFLYSIQNCSAVPDAMSQCCAVSSGCLSGPVPPNHIVPCKYRPWIYFPPANTGSGCLTQVLDIFLPCKYRSWMFYSPAANTGPGCFSSPQIHVLDTFFPLQIQVLDVFPCKYRSWMVFFPSSWVVKVDASSHVGNRSGIWILPATQHRVQILSVLSFMLTPRIMHSPHSPPLTRIFPHIFCEKYLTKYPF